MDRGVAQMRAQVRRQEIREAKRRRERLEQERIAAERRPEPEQIYVTNHTFQQLLAYARATGLVVVVGVPEAHCEFPPQVNLEAAWT